MPKNEASNKYILDAIGRILIIIMIIFFEYRLVNKVAQEGCQISVGLLAAIVIIAGLLVLSLTLFRGSLEQDVQVLKEDVSELKEKDLHKLNRDIEELKEKDLHKLNRDVEELKEKDLHKLNRDVEELKTDLKKLEGQIERK